METWRALRPGTRTLAVIGAIMLLTLFGAAVLADVVAKHPPDRSSGAPYGRPSSEHWLGTDDLGRDLWAQLVHGARITLAIGLAAAIAATVIGTTVALIAGWRGGWLDALVMRIVDLTLSVPFLVLILVLASYFGRGALVTTVLLVGVLWARPARLLRSQVLKLREFGHVVAAESMGARQSRILVRHVLHRLVPLLLSQFVRAAAVAVIVQSGVAFLGLGDPDRVSWGTTLFFANNGAAVLTDAWLWWIVPPGMALTLLIVGLAFVGLAFEEIADPGVTSHGWRPGVRRVLDDTEVRPADADIALDIRDFAVAYGVTTVVDGVDLAVQRGRVFGLVGESGSGKSSLALGVMGLLSSGGRVSRGAALLGEVDLRRLGREGLSRLRGRELSVIPQAAMSLLNPTMTILRQVQESTELTADKDTAKTRAVEMLERVGIPSSRHGSFPHELSGGQRQRVVIAMAVANQPKLLVADEPTTGLDVITQQEILVLLEELRVELDLDILIISHDLPLIAAVADDIAIMYAGEIVETGTVADVLTTPMHPYTRRLVAAMPVLDGPPRAAQPIPGDAPDPSEHIVGCAFAPRCQSAEPACSETAPTLTQIEGQASTARMVACHVTIRDSVEAASTMTAVVKLDEVQVKYVGRRRNADVNALVEANLTIAQGERVAIVGRSGAGKSTIAKLACGLATPSSGSVTAFGTNVASASRRELRQLRRRMHLVFQDPYQSLHPGMNVGDLINEPLVIAGRKDGRESAVTDALARVGLTPPNQFIDRAPATLSGGQRQRVAIARALVAAPELILADEPTSMLDASLRATIANLLLDLQAEQNSALVFITHDLALARQVADRIVVLSEGRIVEDRPTEDLLGDPEHPETRKLLAAARHQPRELTT